MAEYDTKPATKKTRLKNYTRLEENFNLPNFHRNKYKFQRKNVKRKKKIEFKGLIKCLLLAKNSPFKKKTNLIKKKLIFAVRFYCKYYYNA